MRFTALFLVLAACSGAPSRPMSGQERLYRAKCASCHRIYEPVEHRPAEWEWVVDKMLAERKVRLSPEERAEILTYLSGDAAPPLR